jgi:hypothetical protein
MSSRHLCPECSDELWYEDGDLRCTGCGKYFGVISEGVVPRDDPRLEVHYLKSRAANTIMNIDRLVPLLSNGHDQQEEHRMCVDAAIYAQKSASDAERARALGLGDVAESLAHARASLVAAIQTALGHPPRPCPLAPGGRFSTTVYGGEIYTVVDLDGDWKSGDGELYRIPIVASCDDHPQWILAWRKLAKSDLPEDLWHALDAKGWRTTIWHRG